MNKKQSINDVAKKRECKNIYKWLENMKKLDSRFNVLRVADDKKMIVCNCGKKLQMKKYNCAGHLSRRECFLKIPIVNPKSVNNHSNHNNLEEQKQSNSAMFSNSRNMATFGKGSKFYAEDEDTEFQLMQLLLEKINFDETYERIKKDPTEQTIWQELELLKKQLKMYTDAIREGHEDIIKRNKMLADQVEYLRKQLPEQKRKGTSPCSSESGEFLDDLNGGPTDVEILIKNSRCVARKEYKVKRLQRDIKRASATQSTISSAQAILPSALPCQFTREFCYGLNHDSLNSLQYSARKKYKRSSDGEDSLFQIK